ncbi:hypothetical protein GCM10010277_85780 [Streptomyces longisporoflavus]|nr:hypothetical protein GCM10010277_85780 [Streptomyces longisporoflavus]
MTRGEFAHAGGWSERAPGTRNCTPIPKRWAVERTCGWLMLHRRLARDHERLTRIAPKP